MRFISLCLLDEKSELFKSASKVVNQRNEGSLRIHVL